MSLKHVALTGVPGVGKTTLVLKVCEVLKQQDIHLRGFYTQEERVNGKRVGFTAISFDGQRAPLAHIESSSETSRSRGPRVGQYVVNLAAFESLALPALDVRDLKDARAPRTVIVIDEIGKMELFSQRFVTAVQTLLNGDIQILTTIPVPKKPPIPVVEKIRGSPEIQVFQVTQENRNDLLNKIVATILQNEKSLAAKKT